MILADASVLIDFLKGTDSISARKLAKIIDHDIPYGINPAIFMETLINAMTERDFELLRSYLGSQTFYDIRDGRESYARAAKIFIELRKKGIPIGNYFNCLVAQTAIDNDLHLIHNNIIFNKIKKVSTLKTWE